MSKKNRKKKNPNHIFNSIRKVTAPKGQKFKTRKDELHRKAKHKGEDLDT